MVLLSGFTGAAGPAELLDALQDPLHVTYFSHPQILEHRQRLGPAHLDPPPPTPQRRSTLAQVPSGPASPGAPTQLRARRV